MKDFLLEICCGSAEDGLAAIKGGADRIELNSDLFHGGLTPTVGALRVIKKEYPSFPVMCMVRPREGGFCYTETEFEVMKEDAASLIENGADGIVFGFLKPDGTVDKERSLEMMKIIGDKEAVFHRAIDVTPDYKKALEDVISVGVKRILTSGQMPTVPEGVDIINDMVNIAKGRVEILPGGGITPSNISWCRKNINTTMLHAALHRIAFDKSCDNNPAIYFGGAIYPPENIYKVSHPDDIKSLIESAAK